MDPKLAALEARIAELGSVVVCYSGGVDSAFVLGADNEAFMVVGKPAEFKFLKLNQSVTLMDGTEEEEISADDLDFDLI